MRTRRGPEVISGNVGGADGAAKGSGFASIRTTTGSYTLAFPPGFRMSSVTTAVQGAARGWALVIAGAGSNSITIQTQNSAGVVQDLDFHFSATGFPL